MSSEVLNQFKNIDNYASSEYYSDWMQLNNITTFKLITYLDCNYDVDYEYSFDENYDIAKAETSSITSNYNIKTIKPKHRYVRIRIYNISVLPCKLIVQILFNK